MVGQLHGGMQQEEGDQGAACDRHAPEAGEAFLKTGMLLWYSPDLPEDARWSALLGEHQGEALGGQAGQYEPKEDHWVSTKCLLVPCGEKVSCRITKFFGVVNPALFREDFPLVLEPFLRPCPCSLNGLLLALAKVA